MWTGKLRQYPPLPGCATCGQRTSKGHPGTTFRNRKRRAAGQVPRNARVERLLMVQGVAGRGQIQPSPPFRQQVQRRCYLDTTLTQCHRCVMIPEFDENGLLPPGIHRASWDEFFERFAISGWRRRLAGGIRAALEELKAAGCLTVYVNGSFVTAKEVPNDFDACWEEAGVDPTVLDLMLLIFDPGRVTQKAKYLVELFPASVIASRDGFSFLKFFQTDKETGGPKGIIALDLGDLR